VQHQPPRSASVPFVTHRAFHELSLHHAATGLVALHRVPAVTFTASREQSGQHVASRPFASLRASFVCRRQHQLHSPPNNALQPTCYSHAAERRR
jgi:hypothetical protein